MKRLIAIIIVLITTFGLIGCVGKTEPKVTSKDSPENTINTFFTYLKKGDFNKAKEYLIDNKDIEIKDYESLTEGEKAAINYWLEKIGYSIDSLKIISDDEAEAEITISSLDGNKLYQAYKENLLKLKQKILSENNKDKKEEDISKYDEELLKLIKNKNNEIVKTKVNLKLKKKDDKWYIVGNDQLDNAVYGGLKIK